MLADVFSASKIGSLSAGRSVYLALAEIASDKQTETFSVATSYIAQRAGVSSKTVRRVIGMLKKLGFVRIKARSINGLKASNEYTVIRGKVPIGPIYP